MPKVPNRGNFNHSDLVHAWGDRTLVMGVVNVTPDSFSGDGKLDPHAAAQHALDQVHAGADIVDLGAESTRPGFSPVDASQEIERLLPVIKLLRETSNCAISVDTTKVEVFKAAIAAGANILNSIWGLTPELLEAVRERAVPVVLMHNKHEAVYDGDVVEEVVSELCAQAQKALAIGIARENIILDPGIGFGKTAEHNLLVLQGLPRLVELGFPTLLGASRKKFIGKVTGRSVEDRVHGTGAAVALAVAAGVDIVRVHDVAAMCDVANIADCIVRGWRPPGWKAPEVVRANIAIGSNIGDPRKNVEIAIEHISQVCKLVVSSKMYATKPWGVIDQSDFCNAVVAVDTDLSPHDLLDVLQGIEEKMGRTKTYKWGPRLIDLDLLHYGELSISDERLTVPHPHINERAFVLVPLADIDSRYLAVRDLLPHEDLLAVKVQT